MTSMKHLLYIVLSASIIYGLAVPVCATVENGDFETGEFTGWIADPTWVIMDNGLAWYSVWQGKYWAWSGGKGEAATGKLRSKPFKLDKDGVRMLISGWASVHGTGTPRNWNYITLNLADGTEIDRVYAPNTTVFVPAFLDGSKHKGKTVYIEAVDDADEPQFSMLCIDDVRTSDLPGHLYKPVPPIPTFDPKKSIKLEDDKYLVVVDRDNGAIVRIHDKIGKLDLIREPRLAGNFKFTLPLPGKEKWQWLEANYIVGKEQKLSSFELSGNKLTLHWNGPMKSNLDGIYDVSVAMTVELTGDGILFSSKVNNKTRYQVGEAYFPVLGGLQGLGDTTRHLKTTQFIKPLPQGVSSTDIFHVFRNMTTFGDVGPEQYCTYPKDIPECWAVLYAPKLNRSCYIGAHDPKDRPKVIHLELSPSSSGTLREDGNWPRPEELKGLPAGVIFSFVEFANSPARKTYEPSPVFIRFHDGDWKEGKKIYGEWKGK